MAHHLDIRTRSVLDPIHGLIRLTDTEMALIDNPLFQRLRYIKQNGLLHFVFPAATHTRFEHSLGVLYVAHGMLNSLTLNSQVGVSKGTVRSLADPVPGEAAAFAEPFSPEWYFVYKVARLAALAHDLGHGPLSHTFDSFAPTRTALRAVLADPSLTALEPLKEFMLEWGKDVSKPSTHKKNHRTPHEVMSCVFFTKIWHDIAGASDIALAVSAAILGEHCGRSAAALLSNKLAQMWVPLIHDVIASAPADADRMDYMERDSRSIGVTYGLFDRNRVLKSLLCYVDPRSASRIFRLGVKHSGLPAIENLMQARYELFVQIYYHKTNRAIARMLARIGELGSDTINLFQSGDTLDDWIATYQNLSDERFLRALAGDTDYTSSPPVAALTADILERRLWKRVLDPTTNAVAQEILLALRDEFPAVASAIQLDDSKPDALKDLDGGAALLIRNDKGWYEAEGPTSWTQASSIIGALDKADKMAVRLYFDDSNLEVAKQLRKQALALAFEKRDPAHAAS